VSSDELHPADFLYQLASAIKAVRERGGRWNKTADTIQWAHNEIVRLESKLDGVQAALKRDQAERDKWRADWATLYHEHSGALSRLADLELQATSRDEQNADLQSRLNSAAKIIRDALELSCEGEINYQAAHDWLSGVEKLETK
jgi:chromosome segregation ATPase